jgi:plastocyanin
VTGGAAASAAAGEAVAQGQQTIDMTDTLVYEPAEATVAPGTTVVWDNVGSVGHSVTAYEDEIPEGAEFFASGGPFDGEDAARSAYPEGEIGGGGTYEYTFETEGEYGYFCIPHESAGMVGTITVGAGGGGEGGGAAPSIPNSAKTLGVATVSAMASVLLLVYFFLKYGGDYGLD